MEINSNNYQIWISDYFDKKLSLSEEAILLDFLEKNPDLKEEFNDYSNLVIYPDISIRADKSALKKTITDIDRHTLEKYAVSIAENDIGHAEEKEILDVFSKVPGAEDILNLYRKLKLKPEDITYPGKKVLKRIPYRKRFRKLSFSAIAAAAVIALLFSIPRFLPQNTDIEYSYTTSEILFTAPGNNYETLKSLSSNIRVKYIPDNLLRTVNEEANNNIEAIAKREDIILLPIVAKENTLLADYPLNAMLASMKKPYSDNDLFAYSKEKLSPRQFIAMNFRKHILREDEHNTDRLKAYEYADASIDGLNKLLGWDMQFEKVKDDNGRLSSFSFTSQLVNIDHSNKKISD